MPIQDHEVETLNGFGGNVDLPTQVVGILSRENGGTESAVGNVHVDSTPDSDHMLTGATIFPMTAHENMAFGDICYINASGKCAIANASIEATSRAVFICADASISADAIGNFALIASGMVIRDDSWNWSTVGAKVYLSTSGTSGNTWTDTAPSGSGNGIIIVGITLSDDEILISHFVIVEHI